MARDVFQDPEIRKIQCLLPGGLFYTSKWAKGVVVPVKLATEPEMLNGMPYYLTKYIIFPSEAERIAQVLPLERSNAEITFTRFILKEQ